MTFDGRLRDLSGVDIACFAHIQRYPRREEAPVIGARMKNLAALSCGFSRYYLQMGFRRPVEVEKHRQIGVHHSKQRGDVVQHPVDPDGGLHRLGERLIHGEILVRVPKGVLMRTMQKCMPVVIVEIYLRLI